MTDVRVLVVGLDDVAARSLRSAGRQVDRVGTVARALDELDSRPVECVVAAADLPDGSGFDLAAALTDRPAPPATVVVGSSPLADVAEEALDAGVTAYRRVSAGDPLPDDLLERVDEAARTCRQRRDRWRVEAAGTDAACVVRDGRVATCDASFESVVAASGPVCDVPFASLAADADREPLEAAIETAEAEPRTLRFRPAGAPRRKLELTVERDPIDDAVVASVCDVTDRERRERELERDSAMLDSLLSNVPLSIYFKDRLGRHERVSRFITHSDPADYIRNDEGKVHPHPDDLIGKTDFDLYSAEFAEQTVADDRRVIEQGEPVVDRLEHGTTALGEDLYTSTTKAPRYDDEGDVVGLVGVTIDVTDRVQHSQELERQNERLDEFAEVLTHDLRNPLQIAQAHLQNVREEHDSEDVEGCARALDRMQTLIAEIRSFVVEGRTVEDPEAVDLEHAARQAWSTVETGDAELAVEGDLRLRADPERLRRLLENLYRNAVEHGRGQSQDRVAAVEGADTSAAGESSADRSSADERTDDAAAASEPPLRVRVVAHDDGFSVEDDGVGLPSDGMVDVFERGYTTAPDGTGFGLAIVRNIAEAHGWTVEAGESEAGGARFTFSGVVRAEDVLGQTIGEKS